MKKIILIVGGLLLSTSAFAQYPQDFTKDQADSTISLRKAQVSELQLQLKSVQDETASTSQKASQTMADNSKCLDDLYAMLGSSRAGYNAYRDELQRDEQELAQLRGMSPDQLNQSKARVDALETEIRKLRDTKLSLIPDPYRRVLTISSSFMQMKQGMVPPNTTYTVGTWKKDRDCLWNIAKKPEIYNDPFAWPKIWRANMEQIHNPDIIHPGQQLTIMKTPVTEQDKDLTGYHHRR